MAEKKRGFRAYSDEAVKKDTGRDWKAWFAVLDRWRKQDGLAVQGWWTPVSRGDARMATACGTIHRHLTPVGIPASFAV